jgi:Bacterial Ig-like domain (group 3)/FG-GAP repeat
LALGAGNFLLLGKGTGKFQSPIVLDAVGPGIATGDFNRDGRPDLAVGGVTVLLNISVFPTRTTITSSSNPSTYGQSVTFSAVVTPKGSGTPTGMVTFSECSTILGMSPVTGGHREVLDGGADCWPPLHQSRSLRRHKLCSQHIHHCTSW